MTSTQTATVLAACAACFAVAGWAYWASPGTPRYGKYLSSCRAHHVLEQCQASMRRAAP